ncbi:MAG: hypothetical protein ACE5LF_01695 [Alphaproteobacteria bacterium]
MTARCMITAAVVFAAIQLVTACVTDEPHLSPDDPEYHRNHAHASYPDLIIKGFGH